MKKEDHKVLEPHLAVLRAYARLCIVGEILTVFMTIFNARDHIGWTMHKANTLPIILSLSKNVVSFIDTCFGID